MGVTRRTYSHLADAGRMPTAYELVSSELLYHPRLGFAIENPVTTFQAAQRGKLAIPERDSFVDPRETTYASYVELQRRRETFVSELFARTGADYEQRLPAPWLALLERVFAPLRYPCHGLMLLMSYLGSCARDGRRVIALAFTAADETRRVHRFAERLFMLRRAEPDLGEGSRALWERDPAFQPLRELLERTLVSYDETSAWISGELALKPAFDDFVYGALAPAAEREHDPVLANLLGSLGEDAHWHTQASERWLRDLSATPENRRLVSGQLGPALERAERAFEPLVALLDGARGFQRAREARRARLVELGVLEAS